MKTRLGRGFDRLIGLVPAGVDLVPLRDLVADDLVDERRLFDLLGGRQKIS